MAISEKIANNKLVKKVVNSKALNKALDFCAATGASVCMLMTSASATEVDNQVVNGIAAAVNSADIMNNAQPFITAGIGIMCVVGGVKLGTRFLRGSMH